MGISLAMIVKNEARTVARSIASVRNHVDEVVVGLDARSYDGTDKIVVDLADLVVPTRLDEELEKKGPVKWAFPESNDWGFSKARNFVASQCKPDNWRLVLDGHETVLQPEKLASVLEACKAGGHDAAEFWLMFEPGADGICAREFSTIRLMAPSVKYNYPLHNLPQTTSVYIDHSVHIEHRKGDQAQPDKIARDKQRSDSNINGLKEKLRVDSNNPRSWFYLGNTYKENGMYREAVKAYEECLHFSVWNEERWHARFNMAVCHTHLGDNAQAREQYVQALEEFPAMAEGYYNLAHLAYQQKRYREAEVWLLKCMELSIPNCKLFVNPRVYKQSRYDLLSMVYNHQGRYKEAIVMANRALAEAPNERIEKNIGHWEKALGGA